MKITARVDGLDRLARLDAAPFVSRLQAEIERELQLASPASAIDAHRAALARVLRRFSGNSQPSPEPSPPQF